MKFIFPFVFLIALSSSGIAQTNNTLIDTSFSFCSQISAYLPSFSGFPRPSPEPYANKIIVQADDKIIVSGPFRATINGTERYSIFRLNSDGSYDNTFDFFGNPVAQWQAATKVVQLADGKYLVAGSFTQDPGTMQQHIGLYRIHADGSQDTTFNAALIAGSTTNNDPCIYDIELFPNGDILVSGDFLTYDGDTTGTVALLDENGVRKTSFPNQYPTLGSVSVYDVLITPNDKIVVGASSSFSFLILRPNGVIDTASMLAFNPLRVSEPKLELLSNGKILMAGNIGGISNLPSGNEMVRLNADFTLDTTFQIVTGLDKVINNIQVQPDGKILVVGDFININGGSSRKMARLNADGSIDNSFQLGADAFNSGGMIYDVGIQSDGKIVFSHNVGRHNGIILQNNNVNCLVNRLLGDGATTNPTAPLAPSNLTASAGSNITLNWQDNSTNEMGFIIEIAQSNAGPWQTLDSVGQDITTYTHGGLSAGTTYFYRLNAFNSVGVSNYSNTASATALSTQVNLAAMANRLSIYPNPANDVISVTGLSSTATFKIFTLTGQEVLNTRTENQEAIMLPQLQNGIYMCAVYINGYEIVKKLIIQH